MTTTVAAVLSRAAHLPRLLAEPEAERPSGLLRIILDPE